VGRKGDLVGKNAEAGLLDMITNDGLKQMLQIFFAFAEVLLIAARIHLSLNQ
jgi:hypothetical protein